MSKRDFKTCYRCKLLKTINEFHRNKRRPDGVATACKPCAIEIRKDWAKQNKDYVLERDRKYYTLNAEIIKVRESRRKTEHPLKTYAHAAVREALRLGRMSKQTCYVCGADNSDAHHEDYSKPLWVFWLCRSHHKQVHAGSIKLPTETESYLI